MPLRKRNARRARSLAAHTERACPACVTGARTLGVLARLMQLACAVQHPTHEPCARVPRPRIRWHAYTEAEAKDDLAHWARLDLPIDVWALDMNWRNTSHFQDRYYDHPNTALFPNLTEWFAFLRSKRLRTYFNDHPFPLASRGAGGLQLSVEETRFRWSGLSKWMARGLTYWWFDHNWGFSIPPPFVNTSHTSGEWDGLDNAAWGSHVYYESVRAFDRERDAKGDTFYGGRPITLTKFGLPDARSHMDPIRWSESPSQHRYPVWWTGDAVDLQASVESMVDSGVHDLKPYVHSDCGGDIRGSAGNLLRWTGHCAYGTILRFHGSNHKPWSYDAHTTSVIRQYLRTRYALLPSLIAAGEEATRTGFPLVARCDLFWPQHPLAASRDQYLFLNDTLVAPITSSWRNETTRTVWIPPGTWHDAYNGSSIVGPATLAVTQPYERIPLYHRAGGLVVLADEPTVMRVDDQRWSTLILEAFPAADPAEPPTARVVVERSVNDHPTRTELRMSYAQPAAVQAGPRHLRIEVYGDGARLAARSWLLRLHLNRSQAALGCTVDGAPTNFTRLAPVAAQHSTMVHPFGGRGSRPPPLAGPIVEIPLPRAPGPRIVEVLLS